jgi:glycosyltransferase involved in cell wall biosynthesis
MRGVSIVILTLNEEVNIGDCLDSCASCNDIVVFDSISKDRTRDIAQEKGARVVQRRFDNYAAQRNAALTTVDYRNSWVLMVDADERLSPDLAAEIETRVAAADSDVAMFRMRRKDFFMGRWLKRSSGYPTWFGRLIRCGAGRVEREVNEEYITDGRIEHLDEHLLHYPFNRGIAHWFERHNRYSSMEAVAKAAQRTQDISLASVFSQDPTARRRTLKQLAYRMPLRPTIVFCYLYFLRGGIFDGKPGFYYSRMRAAYELLIDLKVIEMRRQAQNLRV